MRRRFNKKILIPITFLLIMSTLLAGCANQEVEYAGSSYEQIIANQLEEMENIAEATENAKRGIIDVAPEASQKALEQFNSINNTSNSVLEILISNESKDGQRILPQKLSLLNTERGQFEWCKEFSDTETFLGYDYTVDFYTTDYPTLGAAIYSTTFSGTSEELYQKYTSYLQQLENNFKPGYGDNYNLVYSEIAAMTDKPYVMYYDLSDKGFFVESMGIYDSAYNQVIHVLAFYRTDCRHNVDGEYGWLLYPIKMKIESGDSEIAGLIELCDNLEGFGNEIISYSENIIEGELLEDLSIKYGY